MLSHTSGIKDFINEPTVDMRKDIQPEEVIESLRKLPLNFPPGEKYAYSNTGYHEWLTLQNPTANLEMIRLTMVNGYGRTYTATFSVGHNTRFTQDITALVLASMVQPRDSYHAFEVSLTVQSLDGALFVAERPMYWNTAGSALPTQGGSDVFGYSGT